VGHAPGSSDCASSRGTRPCHPTQPKAPGQPSIYPWHCATLRQINWAEKLNLLLRIPQQQTNFLNQGTWQWCAGHQNLFHSMIVDQSSSLIGITDPNTLIESATYKGKQECAWQTGSCRR
jgi:hypothetical protein